MSAPRAPTIWTSYDPTRVPPLTSEKHVRFVVISDTHGTEPPNVPDGDVLLHSGDLTKLGAHDEVKSTLDWLVSLPHPIKIIIAGNHDFSLDYTDERKWYTGRGVELHSEYRYPRSDPALALAAIEDAKRKDKGQLIYLENQGATFSVDRASVRHKQWKVWGSPWTPEFGSWAWNYKRGEEARRVHSVIPSDVDVLLTHGPPHELGDLDKILDGSHVGCEELTRKASEGEMRPVIWACGHIHEARGTHIEKYSQPPVQPDTASPDHTVLVNSSIVELDWDHLRREHAYSYKILHQQIIVDIPVDPPQSGF